MSGISYASFLVGAIFNSDIREDMERINYNPFNSDEDKVVESKYVSFYKGVPVLRIANLGGSFSFGIIGLDTQELGYDASLQEVLKHERGHNTQLMDLGLFKFTAFIAIPSIFQEHFGGSNSPWELSASMLGGSSLVEKATAEQITAASNYYRQIKELDLNAPIFIFLP